MSLSLCRKQKKKGWAEAARILAAFLLAGSLFAALLSQLQLSFRLEEAFSGGILSGLTAVWNQAARIFGNTSYTILPVYNGAEEEYGLFLTVSFLILAGIAYLIVRSRFAPLAFLYVLPPFVFGLFFSLAPGFGAILFSVAALFFSLIIMKEPEGIGKAFFGAVLPALLTALILLAVGTDSPLLNSSGKELTPIGEAAADLLYGKDDLGHGNLTKRERKIREGEALSITMSHPQSMYLKGFTGSLWNGNRWEDLSDASYYQAKELMDSLEKEGFYAPGELAQAAEIAYGPLPENEISVKNTGADSRFVYVPYDMTESGTLSNLSVKGGCEFYPGTMRGIREYTYTASENQVDNWTDAASRFFSIALAGDSKNAPAEEEQIAEAADQLRKESHFNTFVYDHFTFLSAADRKLLAETIGSSGDQSKGHMDYKLAIETVRDFLEDQFIYTEDTGAADGTAGGALAEFFSSHKGYDIHFATAATEMFRYYGIPARYAEGYLITPEDAKGVSSGQPLSVSRSRAHAWTEIYIDGVGFVPLEVTPEFYGVMEEADLRIGFSNEKLRKEFQDLYGGKAPEEEPEPETEGKEGDNALSVLYLVLEILAGIGLLILLIFLIPALVRKIRKAAARKKLFYRSEPKTAVAAIYGYMEELHLKPDEEVTALGNRAAYSRQPVSEENRGFMLDALKRLKKEKQGNRNEKKS